ncbi:MAG: hypothetical protein RIT14_1644 [Pseudomonadota bacterium]|jgi:serine/threonine-protein kinase RsbW
MPLPRPEPAQSHRLCAEARAVRAALELLAAGPVLRALPPDQRDAALLVLAEVMNNVVEHGYGGQSGQIRLSLRARGAELRARVIDRGRPFSGGVLPLGAMPPPDSLPEGGFGWAMIRQIACNLRLDRRRDCNVLSFLVPPNAGAVDSGAWTQ